MGEFAASYQKKSPTAKHRKIKIFAARQESKINFAARQGTKISILWKKNSPTAKQGQYKTRPPPAPIFLPQQDDWP